jgi:nicotinate-nucleotide adenylyltransferase
MTDPSQPLSPARVGVLGGTFDPPHIGHLVAASEAATELGLRQVLFVPTGRPWQKAERAVTAAEHRHRMTELATRTDDRFAVSRVDLDRSGPTYTVDTLRDLRAALPPGTELFFLTGADTLASLSTWKDADEVVRLATVVGVSRPGQALRTPTWTDASVLLVPMPGLDISSSDCRDRVRRGASLRYLVPDAVVDYIEEQGLYRDSATLPPPAGPRPAGEVGTA